MSNKAMSWAIDVRVKGSHKLVLMLLADAHNGHTGACFPSQEWIENKSGLGDSTVSACLKDLEDWGLLTRHTKALGRGKGSRRDFELHLEILDPQILEVYNLGVRPPDFTPLDPQILPPPYKEEPEIEPEITGTARDVFDHYTRTAKEAGWIVHSKLTEAIKSSVNARIKDHGAENVKAFITALRSLEWTSKGFPNNPDFRASLVYICRPRTFAEHFDKLMAQRKSAPHANEKRMTYDQWLHAIDWYIDTCGDWNALYGPAPHEDGCLAPHVLQSKAAYVAGMVRKSREIPA